MLIQVSCSSSDSASDGDRRFRLAAIRLLEVTDISLILHGLRCREAPSLFGKSSSKQAKDGRAEQHRGGGAKKQLKRRPKPAKIAKRVFR